jgi:hypothetical protein
VARTQLTNGTVNIQPNTVKIFVGFKPSPYFDPQWVKDMEKEEIENEERIEERDKELRKRLGIPEQR